MPKGKHRKNSGTPSLRPRRCRIAFSLAGGFWR